MKLMNFLFFLVFCSVSVSAVCDVPVFSGTYKNFNITGDQICIDKVFNITQGSEIIVFSNVSVYYENVFIDAPGSTTVASNGGIYIRGGNFTGINVTFKSVAVPSWPYFTINVTDGGILNLTGAVLYNPGYYTTYGESGVLCSDSKIYFDNVSVLGTGRLNNGIYAVGCDVVADEYYQNYSYYGVRGVGSNFTFTNMNISNSVYNLFMMSGNGTMNVSDSYIDSVANSYNNIGLRADNLYRVYVDGFVGAFTRNGSILVSNTTYVSLNNITTASSGYGVSVLDSGLVFVSNSTFLNHSGYGLSVRDINSFSGRSIYSNGSFFPIYISGVSSGNLTEFYIHNCTGDGVFVLKSELYNVSGFAITNISGNGMRFVYSNISAGVSYGNISSVTDASVYIDNSDLGNNTLKELLIERAVVGIKVFGVLSNVVIENVVFHLDPSTAALLTDGVATVIGTLDNYVYYYLAGDGLPDPVDLIDEFDYIYVDSDDANTMAAFNPSGVGGGMLSTGSHHFYHPNIDLPNSTEISLTITSLNNGPNFENLSLYPGTYKVWMGGDQVGYSHWKPSYAIFGTDIYYSVRGADGLWYLVKHNIITDRWERIEISSTTRLTGVAGVFNYNNKIAVFGPTASSTSKRDGLYQLHIFTPVTMSSGGCLTCSATGEYLMRVYYQNHPEYDEDSNPDPCYGSNYCLADVEFIYNKEWTNPAWFYGYDDVDASIVLTDIVFDENGGFWLGGSSTWNYMGWHRDAVWIYFYGDGDTVSATRHVYVPMLTSYSKTAYSTSYPLLYDEFMITGELVSGFMEVLYHQSRVHLTSYSGDTNAGTLSYGTYWPKAGQVGDGVVIDNDYYEVTLDGSLINSIACSPIAANYAAAYAVGCSGEYSANEYEVNTITQNLVLSDEANFTNSSGGSISGMSTLWLSGDGGFLTNVGGKLYKFDSFGGSSVWDFTKTSYSVDLGGDSNTDWGGVILFNGNADNEIMTFISDDFPVCPNNDWVCGQADGRGGLCNEYEDGIPGVLTGAECRAKLDYGEVCTDDADCKTRNCVSGVCGGVTHFCEMNPSTIVNEICVPAKTAGSACTRDAQCQSGKCINGTFLDYSGKVVGQVPNEFWGLAYDNPDDDPDMGYQELGICAPAGYDCSSTISYHEPRYHNGTTQDDKSYTFAGYDEVICGFDESVVSGSDWAEFHSAELPINNVNFTGRQNWCNIDDSGYGVCENYYDVGLDYSILGCESEGVANFEFNYPSEDYYRFGIYASHTSGDFEYVDSFTSTSDCSDLSCSGELDFNDITGDVDQDLNIRVVAAHKDIGDFCSSVGCVSNTLLGDYASNVINIEYGDDCWVTTSSTTTTLPGQTTTTTLAPFIPTPQDGVCDQYCREIGHTSGVCSSTPCPVGIFGCYSEFSNLCNGCSREYCHCAGGTPRDPGTTDVDSPICERNFDEGSTISCSFKGHSTATKIRYIFEIYEDGTYDTFSDSDIITKDFTSDYYNVDFCIDVTANRKLNGDFIGIDVNTPDCESDGSFVQLISTTGGGFETYKFTVIYYDDSNVRIGGYTMADSDYLYYDGCFVDGVCSTNDCELDTNTCSGVVAFDTGYPNFIIQNNLPVVELKWSAPLVCKNWANDAKTICEDGGYYKRSEFEFLVGFTDHVGGGYSLVGDIEEKDYETGIYSADHVLSDYTFADIVGEDFSYYVQARYLVDGVYVYTGIETEVVTIDGCDDAVARIDCSDGMVCSTVDNTCVYGVAGSCASISCDVDTDCVCVESTTYGDGYTDTFCYGGVCRPQITTCVNDAECSSAYPYLSSLFWSGTSTPEFYCQLNTETDSNIWAHYSTHSSERYLFTIPTYSSCWYELNDGEVCIEDKECRSGKCTRGGVYVCDGAGSDPAVDNTCVGDELTCVFEALDGDRDDNICYYDGNPVASCLSDGRCYDRGICVDASTVLCDANNPDGADGDLLCQGPSGLNDPDAYCNYDGICVDEPMSPGEQCRNDDWCDTGYTCQMGVCTAVGSCPWSACKDNYINFDTNEMGYKGRGVLDDGDNCGCGATQICVPASDSKTETNGVCVTPLLNGASCGTGNTLVSWDHGDYLCSTINCIGDEFPGSDGKYGGTCRPATTQCRRNVDVSDSGITWDPEEYCHCKTSSFDLSGNPLPCSNIKYSLYSYSEVVDNILATTEWCYNEGAPRPAGGPENEDYRCYSRFPEGMTCSTGYQCLSGNCVGGVCTKKVGSVGRAGDPCTITHVDGLSNVVWDKYSNGESSTKVAWTDTCGIDLYCDPCDTYGSLVHDKNLKCNNPAVNIYSSTAGICRDSKPDGAWCYSASQCLGYDYMSDALTIKRCIDTTGSGACSSGNPFCLANDPSSFNRFCTDVDSGPCTADEIEPYNEFTTPADDACYTRHMPLGIVSFCTDRHMCYVEGSSGETRECEDISSSYADIVNLVHANEDSKCDRDYCPVDADGKSYLSSDCMRDPLFDDFHVNKPTYSREKSVVYCDGDAGRDDSTSEGGLCMWRKPVGGFCEYDVECMYGLECLSNSKCGMRSCVSDSNCDDGYRCINGKCEYLQDTGFTVVSVNGFTKPSNSPFVPTFDYVVACDEGDYTFRLISDLPMRAKYSVQGGSWLDFGSAGSVASQEVVASVPELCTNEIRSGNVPYEIRTLSVAPVLSDAAVDGLKVEKRVLVLYQALDVDTERCYGGSSLNDYCGAEEDRDKFVLESSNTYISSGNEIDDPRRFKCDSSETAGGNYETPIYPRTDLSQFGDYRYALITDWSTQKYFKCVDEYGYEFEGSTLINPAEALFNLKFTWQQQIVILLILVLGIPTLVLAGTKKR